MKIKIVLNLIVILFVSCNSSDDNKLKNETIKILYKWNLKSEVDLLRDENGLNISIKYIDPDIFYLDEYSNDLIIKLLYFKLNKTFNFKKTINIITKFQNYPDFAKYKIDRVKKNTILKYFSNDIFVSNIDYSLTHFTYDDIIFFNSSIKYIVDNSSKFPTKYKYWELIKYYSYYCSTKNESLINQTELFIVMIGLIKNVKYENEPINAVKKLSKILDQCNINNNIVDMNMEEIESMLLKSTTTTTY